jgi:hypothetical protein
MIDEDIIVEMGELLTYLTYSIRQPDSDAYYRVFISLKNLYDSIGYYTYSDLEPKDVWAYSFLLTLELKEFSPIEDDIGLPDRIKKVIAEIQHYLDSTHGKQNFMVIPESPKGFKEFYQLERDIKMLTWRYGSCLAIYFRAGGKKSNQLTQFLLQFLKFLNRGLYGSQGISIIETNLLQSKKYFNKFSSMFVGYPFDIIKREYNYTINELKKKFKL